ncbi:MAG TPA: SDR family NAD(P)-dependent oxidoreductase [Steroidobacteraceae bacterium]|jgi:NAD(P)-dependent dehydrogenase (short-subunit alcohol dehydrogenase family)|nr:SDR family NAD(P)-dependent oxidoreductase [Steroidobacteraceae bacterium]
MSQNRNKGPLTAEALTADGQARRGFLGTAALATAATAAAGIVATGRAVAAAPDNCPVVPTPMRDVAGKVAFITGGDSGIGLGIARAFTDAGMKVVITYRTRSHLDEAMKLLQGAADRVHAINLDVTDRAAMERAADETAQVFGKVHVLVNNAGVAVIGGLSRASYEDWDWAMSVNAGGVFNGVRCFLPRIQAQGEGGQIVSVSSLAGLLGHAPAGVYTASKFAVVGMMEALRAELADTNIGVTVFCPGIVNTNIGSSARNRPGGAAPAAKVDPGFKMDPAMMAQMQKAMSESHGAPPGMDPLDAGRRVLRGVRNNDLYVLTTPEFEPEFAARGEAIVASLPTDVSASKAREMMGRMILGKPPYATERDRRRCERAKKA